MKWRATWRCEAEQSGPTIREVGRQGFRGKVPSIFWEVVGQGRVNSPLWEVVG